MDYLAHGLLAYRVRLQRDIQSDADLPFAWYENFHAGTTELPVTTELLTTSNN